MCMVWQYKKKLKMHIKVKGIIKYNSKIYV